LPLPEVFVLAHGWFFLFVFLYLFRVFRPLWASYFLYTDIESNQRNPPHRVGLRLLCALQSEPGAVNSGYALRQAPRYSGPDFQCSTTQKGMKVKTGAELLHGAG